MAAPLIVCPSCSRHVRVGEAVCPFCVAPVPAELIPVPPGPRRNYIGKGATALALASALAATGCSDDATTTPASDAAAADTQTQSDTATTPDTEVEDSTTDTSSSEVATDAADADAPDEGGAVPLYK
ncbi:MAG: hypothetical protein ACXWUG_09005 [Polyangiales bacterium]